MSNSPPDEETPFSRYASVLRPGLFAGEVHWVTGGGSGIGRCVAHELAALGATVILTGRTEEKLHKVAAEIAEDGGRAEVSAFDIRIEEAVTGAVSSAVAKHGRIHGLVNNAGGQFPAPLALINQKGWETVVRTNLTGGFLVARECYTQHMAQAEGDHAIVNIIADMWNGMPGMGHSGAARAGMLNFTETAALEWAPVRSNAVAPGWIASSGMDHYPPDMAELLRGLPKLVPAQRMGNEDEVSAAVVFLLSPAAAFISGSCLRIDGGAPNAKRLWPQVGNGTATPELNAFHLATKPKVLS